MTQQTRVNPPSNTILGARRLVTACLDGLKIHYQWLTYDGIELRHRNGSSVLVIFTDAPPAEPSEFAVEVSAKELLSRKPEVVAAAFAQITAAGGYGTPAPISRGPARTKRPYGDDHDSVAWREGTFRRSPNPSAEVYQQTDKIVGTCVRFFYFKNRQLCMRLSFDVDDLKTFAQVWTANFFATSRIVDEPMSSDGNQKLLYKHLRQHFAWLYSQMRGIRSRSLVLDRDALSTSLNVEYVLDAQTWATGEATAISTNQKFFQADYTIVDADPVRKRKMEVFFDLEELRERDRLPPPNIDLKSRTKEAKVKLTKALSELPCDQLLLLLEQVGTSPFTCIDTKKEASKQYLMHSHSCTACSLKPLPPFVEKSTAVDFFGGEVDENNGGGARKPRRTAVES